MDKHGLNLAFCVLQTRRSEKGQKVIVEVNGHMLQQFLAAGVHISDVDAIVEAIDVPLK